MGSIFSIQKKCSVYLFVVYLSGEDDDAGVGVVEGNEGGGRDVGGGAGNGPGGQGLSGVQVQGSLTATAEGGKHIGGQR